MATMKDVAKLAGVSTSTVSHVINQSRYVSEEMTARIQRAAKELNYAPSVLARSLKMNRTRTIGLLVTTSTNPFYGEVVKGVERQCYNQNYNLILCNTEGSAERMKDSIGTLMAKKVDGLLILCPTLEEQHLNIFDTYPNFPTVVMDWGDATSFASDKINDNSEYGGYLAGKHLIDNGHKNIGCITGPLNRHQAKIRYAGFLRAMEESGLAVNPEWVIESNFESDGGYEAFNQLADKEELPSALFVCNDMMAMGLISAADKKGIRIPEDLSIIGYDDISISQYMVPALTTIHQPKFHLGQVAAERLMQIIEKEGDKAELAKLEPEIVIRDSVRAL